MEYALIVGEVDIRIFTCNSITQADIVDFVNKKKKLKYKIEKTDLPF